MITTEELARIRAAAVGDMLGDPGALDEMGSAATIFRLCRELELATKRAVAMSEVAAAAWEGEIPSPLPGHTHMTRQNKRGLAMGRPHPRTPRTEVAPKGAFPFSGGEHA